MLTTSEATRRFLRPISLAPDDRLDIDIKDTKKDVLELRAYRIFGSRRVSASFGALGYFRRLPEGRQRGHGHWTAPPTDYTVYLTRQLWSNDRITVSDFAKPLLNYVLTRGIVGERLAETTATFKSEGTLPDFGYQDHPEYPLSPYQVLALHNSLLSTGYALYMDMGTGKTAVSVANLCNRAMQAKALGQTHFRSLVICPKNVQLNWANEIEKFKTVPLHTALCKGTSRDRLNTFMEFLLVQEPSVLVCSYDVLRLNISMFKTVMWDVAVLDESHLIKNFSTARTKAALDLVNSSKARLILSGTPISNAITDLYPQLEFLDPMGSGFSSYSAFRQFHTTSSDHPQGMLEETRRVPFLQERLAKTAFFISKAEALPHLPDKTYSIREAEMTDEQASAYQTLSTQLMLEINTAVSGTANAAITVSNTLTKLLRLAQITSGHMVYQVMAQDPEGKDEQRLVYFNPNPKLDVLKDLVNEHDNKMVVWTHFTADATAIVHMLESCGVEHVLFTGKTNDTARAEALRRFEFEDDCKVFVGNAAAGGVGLNLLGSENVPCDKVVFYSQGWSSVTRGQAEDRAHRIGVKKSVEIVDLVIPKTIDERIRLVVLEKITSAMTLTDLSSVLAEVLAEANVDATPVAALVEALAPELIAIPAPTTLLLTDTRR